MRLSTQILAVGAAATAASPAAAELAGDPDGYARIGVARVKLADDGDIFLNGTQDPLAGYETPEDWVVGADLGYFVLDRVAVQFSATTPATTSNLPAGSLAGLPNLGTDRFSLFGVTAVWHPLRGHRVSPYAGAGLAYLHIWDVDDGLATDLELDDAIGPVVHGGVEIALSGRFGLFADVRYALIENDASGDIGPLRVTAEPELDPLVLSAGALIRF